MCPFIKIPTASTGGTCTHPSINRRKSLHFYCTYAKLLAWIGQRQDMAVFNDAVSALLS
jgi:hypothetical protein